MQTAILNKPVATNIYSRGADPEVFLRNMEGKFISSIGLVGGSKEYPRPIGEGCAVQEDNVSVEFNTPPCTTADDFVKAIQYNLDYLKTMAEAMNLEICITPSAVFDDDQLQTMEAQTFGCEPDFNAWQGGAQNPRPSASNPNLRSAGGHIHLGGIDGLDILEVVKACDWFIGCQMIQFDDDTARRELYGKPGAFRKKSYGVEYRTASNRWIESDERIRWVWDQSEKAIAFVRDGNSFTEEQGQLIQKCINNSCMDCFHQLMKELPL